MAFEIMTIDGDMERVDDANAYQLEGPLTTFFIADGGHGKLSSWSQRVCSLRTDRISSIRRVVFPDMESEASGAGERSEVLSLRAV